ncbi:hypothetical protein [Vibrio palustris]|uniref:Bacterial Ig domain-containing protein n=1 Tax=Vibrio palustris TaxID=1918946 RepID=A0A1R4B611_9VIBR|nr:hypothetical protein [Vibrio palustris]SJL84326.1 hypothetical protein VPAL9027_02308 [Vibrio palustris]
MKKLTAILAATLLTASAAASAANTDSDNMKLNITTVANRATVTLTKNGDPAKGYPVKVKGINNTMNKVTSDQGSFTIQNRTSQPERVSFIVEDTHGKTIVKQRFIARES